MQNAAPLSLASLVSVALACGTAAAPGSAVDPPASSEDAGSPPVVDADAAADATPAFHPAAHRPQPQVQKGNGAVLAHPKVVPITFTGDPLTPAIDAFVSGFATTTYWGDVTAEYGIAPVKPLPPVHVAETVGATIDDSDIRAWLAARLDGTHPELPAPDADTIYAIFYPAGTTVTSFGASSCSTFHGYHGDIALPGGADVPYAVISRCDTLPEIAVTGIQYVSAVASHELVEAMTDPRPDSAPAYSFTDPDHQAWMPITGGEVGDMCALQGDAFFTPADFPYTVQRIWSNAAATAGTDPCVPKAKPAPYVLAVPELDDTISFIDPVQGVTTATRGVTVPVGQSRTIAIDLFSDAPSAPWTVGAFEAHGGKTLGLVLDRTSGKNGDTLHLTITAKGKNTTLGASPVVITSTLGTQRNLWFGLVGY